MNMKVYLCFDLLNIAAKFDYDDDLYFECEMLKPKGMIVPRVGELIALNSFKVWLFAVEYAFLLKHCKFDFINLMVTRVAHHFYPEGPSQRIDISLDLAAPIHGNYYRKKLHNARRYRWPSPTSN